MKFCSKCKATYEDSYKYCIACGSELQVKEEIPVCEHCGKPIEAGARFCTYCGYKVAAPKVCHCGAELEEGQDFCPECKCYLKDDYVLPTYKKGSWVFIPLAFCGAFLLLSVISMII